MPRSQDVHYDYEARQQYLRQSSRAPSRRPRKQWPPPAQVEDEVVSLSHEYNPGLPDIGGRAAYSRGSLDQQPIILDIQTHDPHSTNLATNLQDSCRSGDEASLTSTSSDDSLEPETPTDSAESNKDRRYVFVPQKGVEIPLTYDEPRTPIHNKRHEPQIQTEEIRGRRKAGPELDTDVAQSQSTFDTPIRIERERSPYSHAPRSKEHQASGGHLLSPKLMSPRVRQLDEQRQFTESAREAPTGRKGEMTDSSAMSSNRPPRPSMARHASVMAYPSEPLSARDPRCSPIQRAAHPVNLDTLPGRLGSDAHDSAMLSPDTPRPHRRFSINHLDDRLLEKRLDTSSPTQPNSQAPRAVPVAHEKKPKPAAALHSGTGLQNLDARLSESPYDRRHASPRPSPQASPHGSHTSSPISPPLQTPLPGSGSYRNDYFSAKHSVSDSRSDSLLNPASSPQLTNMSEDNSLRDTATRKIPGSRRASPSTIPTGRSLDPNSQLRTHARSPSPGHHRRSSTYSGEELQQWKGRPKSPQPTDMSSQSLRPAELQGRRRSYSAAPSPSQDLKDCVQPADSLEQAKSRHLSLRPSAPIRAASVGAPPASLPPCPRSSPVSGYNDWYLLHDSPAFLICPSCQQAVSDAGYGRYFERRFSTSTEQPLRCTFSVPWVRIAYLLMLKKGKSNANLLYEIAEVADDTPSCPGNRPAIRDWYRISDTDSDRSVSGFYACPYCVESLETIFPVLQGIFYKSKRHHSTEKRTCTLRYDSSRFATYVDSLEDTAKQAQEYRRAPNTHRFVELIKKLGPVRPCTRDAMIRGQAWYIIPQLPELTACAECYEDVVWPAVARGSDLASRFVQKPQAVAAPPAGVSCHLYSAKMRTTFQEACETEDFEHLREMGIKRFKLERELHGRMEEAKRYSRAQQEKAMAEIVEQWQDWDR